MGYTEPKSSYESSLASPASGFEYHVVGIAEYGVSKNPKTVLTTHSLGSCLGIAIYDPIVKVGGMLHIMLPSSRLDMAKAAEVPSMFLDTGIALLFRSAYELGAEKRRILLYVAGGAQVMDTTGFFNIGKRNYEALQTVCEYHNLTIQAEQVGGLISRSIYLKVATGEVWVKASGQFKSSTL